MSERTIRIGLAGLGTVGGGVAKLLDRHRDLLAQRCGARLEVGAVFARDRAKRRDLPLAGVRWHESPEALASDPQVDVVVELIGGSDGVARTLVEAALRVGKPVVTANKALIAHHGTALARLAEASKTTLSFEASVAGGIPTIKALREGLAGNRIGAVHGILNGTCNYILTEMQEGVRAGKPREFADVLAESQRLGYAEADPTMDIDGHDAAHKLAILTSVAFGCAVDLKSVHVEGIRHISAVDIEYAMTLGYRIKLLCVSRSAAGGILQRVHPAMVSERSPIAHVDGVFNAVVTQGDFVGPSVFEGRGAGEGPTASAVVADLVDLARGLRVPCFGVPVDRLTTLPPVPMAHHVGAYYIRLMVVDRPGVIADVAACLRDEQVSVESMLQRSRNPGEAVPVVLTTHDASEASLTRALATIARLGTVLEPPRMIRIESL
ncbi:MAG: homoserine dehydrogenase [Alphaproteobacteria bacterium]|nr:homoserine dehydrogenase [Alphaproteobacteria bacterium]